jgi:hypothetical protein
MTDKSSVCHVVCHLDESQHDYSKNGCGCAQHIHYSVSGQRHIVGNGDTICVQFPETLGEAVSPSELPSIGEERKDGQDDPFTMMIEIPGNISALGCPEGKSCRHFHIHTWGNIFQTVYVSLLPAPACSGYKGKWWVVEIAVHQITQDQIDLDKNSCSGDGEHSGPE